MERNASYIVTRNLRMVKTQIKKWCQEDWGGGGGGDGLGELISIIGPRGFGLFGEDEGVVCLLKIWLTGNLKDLS